MLAVIVASFVLIGRHWIDPAATRALLVDAGIRSPWIYLGLCLYWIFLNSVLEEMVWRWFVYEQFLTLLSGSDSSVGSGGDVAVRTWQKAGAAILSGLAFTIHHTLALGFNFAWDWRLVSAGSLGVFLGGLTWSALYARYGSIWPGWISHGLADVGVFVVGAMILYG